MFCIGLFLDINECHTHPCLNGATCHDQVNGYSCTCASGYTGGRCETGTLKNHIRVLLLPLLLSSHLLVIVDVIILLVSLFWVIHLYYSHNSFAVLVYFQITTSVTLIRV